VHRATSIHVSTDPTVAAGSSIVSLFRSCVAIVWLVAAWPIQAVTCQDTLWPSNPDSVYAVNGDGTATDTRTGLMWKVCAEGQTWSAGTCGDTETPMNWPTALSLAETTVYAGHSDWRLPNVKELRSLVEECRNSPAINDSVFPGTSNANFWSASPGVYHPYVAWFVSFGTGYASSYNRSFTNSVRLVRDAQPSGSYSLSVGKTGEGFGTVGSTPSGIDCGSQCTADFSIGLQVTLGAIPTPGTNSRFVQWGGACTGTQSTCTVTMNAAKSVTAEFGSAMPGVPTILRITSGFHYVRLYFLPPSSNGGADIVSYTASCVPSTGGIPISATAVSSPITVTGLVDRTTYHCSLHANNGIAGPESPVVAKKVGPASIVPILTTILDN
jgi:hypothetical protein